MFIVLLGFTALATEVGFVLFKQRQMQSAASAAALGGATALMTGHPAVYSVEANAIATQAGFTSGTANAIVTTVTVSHPPPISDPNSGNANDVYVKILQPYPLPLSSLFGIAAWQIQAIAVATEGNTASDCVLQLDPASTVGVSITNGAAVTMNLCGLGVNANGSSALLVQGASLTAASVSVAGLVTMNNGGTINSTKAVQTSQPPVANPYSGITVPTYSGCAYNNLTTNYGTTTLSPNGTYCGGINMGGGGTVIMNPGVYIMNGGTFNVQGGVTLSGTNVTIVLTGSGTNYATVSIGNGSSVTLSAPVAPNATAGLVFFQDPNAPTTGTDTIAGGTTLNLTGALYFPSQTLNYSNGTSASSQCTQLVAWNIVFTGGASFNSSCASAGVSTIGAGPSQLVE